MAAFEARSKPVPRSPIKVKPKRQAGQSLRELLFEDRDAYVFYAGGAAVGALASTIAVWWTWWTSRALTPWIVTGTAIAMLGAAAIELRKRMKRGKNTQLGLEGEVAVGQMLDELRSRGYQVLHDLPGERENTNIDHVLVGRGGVFVIETKTRSKRGNEQISYDGRWLRIGRFDATNQILPQARACRDDVRRRLQEQLGRADIPVRGVVVFPGWWIEGPARLTGPNDIWVVNPKQLAGCIGQADALTSLQVSKIVDALAKDRQSV